MSSPVPASASPTVSEQGEPSVSTTPDATPSTATVATRTEDPAAAAMDRVDPAILSFFAKLARGPYGCNGAMDTGPPETMPTDLAKAARMSTAVIVAEVVGVSLGRSFGDGDPLQAVNVEIRPVSTLSGALRTPPDETVFVEDIRERTFLTPERLAELNASIPTGYLVWFLIGDGPPPGWTQAPDKPTFPPGDPRLYQTMGGVWAQGEGGVVDPIDPIKHRQQGWRFSILREAESFERLSDLAEYVRATSEGTRVPTPPPLPAAEC